MPFSKERASNTSLTSQATILRSAFMHSSLRPLSLALLSLAALLNIGAVSRGPTPPPPPRAPPAPDTPLAHHPPPPAAPPRPPPPPPPPSPPPPVPTTPPPRPPPAPAAPPAGGRAPPPPPKTAAVPHPATSKVHVAHQPWNPPFDSHALAALPNGVATILGFVHDASGKPAPGVRV